MKKRRKILITGATGQIAYSLIFRLLDAQQIFAKDVGIDLSLYDLPPTQSKLQGLQMELEDCAFEALQNVNLTTDINQACQDVDLAILLGAMPRTSAAMQRNDLLRNNANIFREQGQALNAGATSDLKVLVVGNPCNTNCMITMHNAMDVPRDRFFAMTMLDEKRARYQLAAKAQVDVKQVNDMIIWGNHSNTMFPDFYHARIDHKQAIEVIDEHWLKQEFLMRVRTRGAEIIKARGLSSGASAANAVLATIRNLYHDTDIAENYSVACCANGEYGVDENLIFSFPCRTRRGKVEIIPNIVHENSFAKEALQQTLDELRSEKNVVKELGFI